MPFARLVSRTPGQEIILRDAVSGAVIVENGSLISLNAAVDEYRRRSEQKTAKEVPAASATVKATESDETEG